MSGYDKRRNARIESLEAQLQEATRTLDAIREWAESRQLPSHNAHPVTEAAVCCINAAKAHCASLLTPVPAPHEEGAET